MSQAHRIKRIIKNLTHWKQKILFEFILIQFFKTCLFVKTSSYSFQMYVFFTFLNTRIRWEACNQAAAPAITRPISMTLVVTTADLQYADTCKPTQIIGLTFTTLRSLAVTTMGDGCRFLNLCWFKTTDQSWMQTSRRCLYAFLTCRRPSCFTHDVTRHHHWRVSSWVM